MRHDGFLDEVSASTGGIAYQNAQLQRTIAIVQMRAELVGYLPAEHLEHEKVVPTNALGKSRMFAKYSRRLDDF